MATLRGQAQKVDFQPARGMFGTVSEEFTSQFKNSKLQNFNIKSIHIHSPILRTYRQTATTLKILSVAEEIVICA
jgi:glutamine amidotransferase PdxT